jgi:putative flippase GtrA
METLQSGAMLSNFRTFAVRTIRNPLDGIVHTIASRFGNRSAEVARFLKFSVVGGIGFVVDFGTVFVLQATILPPVNDVNVIIATAVAFTLAIISNFTWNRYWTYPESRSRSAKRQLTQFTIISIVGGVVRTAWIRFAYVPLGLLLMPIVLPVIEVFRPSYVPSHTAEAKLGTMVAQFIGVIVVLFWNFFANRYWTYRHVK